MFHLRKQIVQKLLFCYDQLLFFTVVHQNWNIYVIANRYSAIYQTMQGFIRIDDMILKKQNEWLLNLLAKQFHKQTIFWITKKCWFWFSKYWWENFSLFASCLKICLRGSGSLCILTHLVTSVQHKIQKQRSKLGKPIHNFTF